jgi:septal ring factor EnvC (AmiA/AmiB activator)
MLIIMTKEQLIAMGLTEEQANQVMESLNGNFVTKTRFDEVNTAKKQLETDLKTRDTQLEELKKNTGDAEALQKTITELQAANATKDAEHAAAIKKMQIDNAVEKALIGAKAKNTKAVKALIADFLEKAELDGENIKGLDDEIKKLTEAEDSKFLFDVETKKQTTFKGIKPGEKNDKTPGDGVPNTLADAVNMHYENNE